MSQDVWRRVDRYIEDTFIPADPDLDEVLAAATRADLPPEHVAPNQGKLLSILAKAIHARSILEIGTLAGYSTIWLARALEPGGRLVTLEADPRHAEVALKNVLRVGLGGVDDIRLGPALKTLPTLRKEIQGGFDFVFIDADKGNNSMYFDWALELTHTGSLIVADNVIRAGEILRQDGQDERVTGVRNGNAAMGGNLCVMATALQTVGIKGHDGFAIALVIGCRHTEPNSKAD